MRNVMAIARKELNIYFTTPIAYVMFCGTTFIASYMFIAFLQQFTQASQIAMQMPKYIDPTKLNLTDLVMSPLLGNIGVIFVFIIPFVTMRLMAEEKRQRTFELLMTTPVRPTEIVLGKFLAGAFLVALTLVFTLVYPIVLQRYGLSAGTSQTTASPIEWSTVLGGYLGLFLWGSAAVAIGLFVSSLTENQAIAAIVTFVILLLTWLVGWVGKEAGGMKELFTNLSSIEHLRSLSRGEIKLADLLYFVSLIVLGLFLSQRTIESQRWS